MKKTKNSLKLLLTALITFLVIIGVTFGGMNLFAKAGTEQESESRTADVKKAAPTSFSVNSFNSTSSTNSTYNDRYGLGYCVDAVKNRYIDLTELKDQSPIFNVDWLNTQLSNANRIDSPQTSMSYYSAGTIRNFVSSLNAGLGYDMGVDLGLDLFSIGAENAFAIESGIDYSKKHFHYFYKMNKEVVRYTYSLPNYPNRNLYKQNLNSDYEAALTKLFNGTMSPAQFFNTYGTHVILKGKYGGLAEIYYGAAADDADLGVTLKTKVDNTVKAKLFDEFGGSNDISVKLAESIEMKEKTFSEGMTVNTFGGAAYTGSNINDFSKSLKKWTNSVEANPTMIGTSSDGLVPLWELLPLQHDTAAKIKQLKDWFTEYANSRLKELDKSFEYTGNYPKVQTGFIKFYRPYDSNGDGQFTIKDDNPCYKYGHDYLSLEEEFVFPKSEMVKRGYNKIQVSIKLNVKERNDGYQDYYLYNDEIDDDKYKENSKYLLQKVTGAYHSGVVWNTWGDVTVNFNTFDLSKFNDKIFVYYGAHGSGEDTWYNRNLRVNITYSKV